MKFNLAASACRIAIGTRSDLGTPDAGNIVLDAMRSVCGRVFAWIGNGQEWVYSELAGPADETPTAERSANQFDHTVLDDLSTTTLVLLAARSIFSSSECYCRQDRVYVARIIDGVKSDVLWDPLGDSDTAMALLISAQLHLRTLRQLDGTLGVRVTDPDLALYIQLPLPDIADDQVLDLAKTLSNPIVRKAITYAAVLSGLHNFCNL